MGGLHRDQGPPAALRSAIVDADHFNDVVAVLLFIESLHLHRLAAASSAAPPTGSAADGYAAAQPHRARAPPAVPMYRRASQFNTSDERRHEPSSRCQRNGESNVIDSLHLCWA